MSIAQSEKTLPLRTLRNSAEFAEEELLSSEGLLSIEA